MATPENKRARWQRISSLTEELFNIDLGEFVIYVRMALKGGKVVDFSVVLTVWRKDEQIQVARYDRAHDYTHIDLLDLKGRVDRKEYRDSIPIEKAVRYAIDDFKENWEKYARRCFDSKGRHDEKERRAKSRRRSPHRS